MKLVFMCLSISLAFATYEPESLFRDAPQELIHEIHDMATDTPDSDFAAVSDPFSAKSENEEAEMMNDVKKWEDDMQKANAQKKKAQKAPKGAPTKKVPNGAPTKKVPKATPTKASRAAENAVAKTITKVLAAKVKKADQQVIKAKKVLALSETTRMKPSKSVAAAVLSEHPKWHKYCEVATSKHRLKGKCRAYKRFCKLYKKFGLHEAAKNHCDNMRKAHAKLTAHKKKPKKKLGHGKRCRCNAACRFVASKSSKRMCIKECYKECFAEKFGVNAAHYASR